MPGPSWRDSDWSYRVPCLVDSTGSSGSVDISITVPQTLQILWSNTMANGEDIRVTAADGVTDLTYQLVSWSQSTQSGSIEIDNYTLPNNSQYTLLWVYFGNSGASSAAGSFTASTPITGYLTPERPSNHLVLGPNRVGATTASTVISKDSNETLFVYVALDIEVSARCGPDYEGGAGFEGPESILYEVYTSGGAVSAARDYTLARVTDCATNGEELWLRTAIKGGSDNTNYIVYIDITTTEGRILRRSYEFQVRDVAEST